MANNMNKFPSGRFEQDDTVVAVLAAILTEHRDMVQRFRSDLIHDGIWLQSYVFRHKDPVNTFYYGLREAGTSIGTDAYHCSISNDFLYRITVTRREEGYVMGKAEQIPVAQNRQEAIEAGYLRI